MSTNDPRSIAPPDSPSIGARRSQPDYFQDASRHQFWSSSPSTESLALQQERIRHRNEIIALAAQRDAANERNAKLLGVVAGIGNANRFERAKFIDDEDFVTWAQSLCRAAVAQNAGADSAKEQKL